MKAIKIKLRRERTTYIRKKLRRFPIPLTDAELLIATEQAYQMSADAKFA